MLGLKKKGVVKICRVQGEPFGLRGVKLSRREFGFRRRKGLLLALDSTHFQNFSPAASSGHLTLLKKPIFKKIHLQQAVSIFRK